MRWSMWDVEMALPGPITLFHVLVYFLGRFHQLPWYRSKLTFYGSFHLIPWKQAGGRFTSMEASMEIDGSRFNTWNFVKTSMEVYGSFQRF